ncbi:hypothetical protein LTR84_004320 [Exophiala bonariae]|uniref:Kinetochore protein Mis13/DSN1 n=1 Tax=Exophiala bonariae TaxID=1690606 RepID=A0AAV9N7T0_9EURO|nr:hypothetical protein LTR84_004320 [Exophiala bonariae]
MSERRLSARLHQKDVDPPNSKRVQGYGNVKTSKQTSESLRAQAAKSLNEKKRKLDYDEDDDGFLFTRVKKQKPPPKEIEQLQLLTTTQQPLPQSESLEHTRQSKGDDAKPNDKKGRKRLSFSTPTPNEQPSVRRSKRLSREYEDRATTPVTKPERKAISKQANNVSIEEKKSSPAKPKRKPPKQPVVEIPRPTQAQTQPESQPPPSTISEQVPPPQSQDQIQPGPTTIPTQDEDHAATKIALPFADTPVIKRNKAMREGKGGKGERRSSLGFRGRRASSLIETGNSNALPHSEVEIPDFYKHIESEGLLEPRRMRQLLTWCATRLLDEKPMGTDFEDASARSAARVIEEELLNDLANRSELSDWFSREDAPIQTKPLPHRANPRNLQNAEKISELEVQIKRLQAEKSELESLLRPPSVPDRKNLDLSAGTLPVGELVSQSDNAALAMLQQHVTTSVEISKDLGELYDSIEPTIDAFADGMHRIGQYRDAADTMAGRVLSICAEGLAKRDKEERKRALASDGKTPPKDLSAVLRSLSRADR